MTLSSTAVTLEPVDTEAHVNTSTPQLESLALCIVTGGRQAVMKWLVLDRVLIQLAMVI